MLSPSLCTVRKARSLVPLPLLTQCCPESKAEGFGEAGELLPVHEDCSGCLLGGFTGSMRAPNVTDVTGPLQLIAL